MFRAKQSDQQTNKRGCSVLSWRHHGSIPWLRASSPALSCTKGGNLKLSLVFNKTKNSFLILRDAITACWRAWRPSDHWCFAFADALGPSHAITNKEAMPPDTYLIVSGSYEPDFHGVTFRHAAIICSTSALVRILSAKRSERLNGDRRLVTAFACK